MDFSCEQIIKYTDKRGFLIEFLKADQLNNKKEFAQIYCATLHPGYCRGNHYHKTKDEWITILQGKTTLILIDVLSHEKKEVFLDADSRSLTRVRIGRHLAHAFRNDSDSIAILVAYTTKVYDPNNLDQNEYKVIE